MEEKVKQFNELVKKYHPTQMSVFARLLDVQSELGELNKEALKATKYGTKNFSVTPDFTLELGDVLYAVLSLAQEVGVSAEHALDVVLEKYTKRLNEKQNLGSQN